MDNEKLIKDAIEYVSKLLESNSGGHDAAHSLRVYNNALAIAENEPGCNLTVVSLAAILHDADDHKLFDHENNENTREFLKENGVSDELTEEICRAINSVSFSKNRGKKPETIEGMIVQDADRLDAIGAIGIARTFAFGGKHGRSPEDSIAHFHEKLLLLKDMMNTDTAKLLAEDRHNFMQDFLQEWDREVES